MVLLRPALVALALGLLWLVTARWIVAGVDRVFTVQLPLPDQPDGPYIPAFAPPPGFPARPEAADRVLCELRRSALAWPTPLKFNFMTGQVPRYRRNTYYRIWWTRHNGQRLEAVWRFTQGYTPVDGWTTPFMTEEGWTGLMSLSTHAN